MPEDVCDVYHSSWAYLAWWIAVEDVAITPAAGFQFWVDPHKPLGSVSGQCVTYEYLGTKPVTDPWRRSLTVGVLYYSAPNFTMTYTRTPNRRNSQAGSCGLPMQAIQFKGSALGRAFTPKAAPLTPAAMPYPQDTGTILAAAPHCRLGKALPPCYGVSTSRSTSARLGICSSSAMRFSSAIRSSRRDARMASTR